jgi:hypothetical protein
LGEDCWSRGLQSACFWLVAGWRVVHSGASLVDVGSIATPAGDGQSGFTRIALRAEREQGGLFEGNALGARGSQESMHVLHKPPTNHGAALLRRQALSM